MENEMNNFEVEGTLERMKMIKRGTPLSTLWPSDIDIIINALEKRIQKKPIKSDRKIRYCEVWKCPKCDFEWSGRVVDYCYKCGQAINLEGVEEE